MVMKGLGRSDTPNATSHIPERAAGRSSQRLSDIAPAAARELLEILGHRNVTDDPAFICGYSWTSSSGGAPSSKQLAEHRPVAIVLPSSTQEVQAVVKACRRHNLKFRAHSTGTAAFHCVQQDRVVSLDLRRMDKIVELDAKNQMAVIEPYVTAGQLQAEAMKVGLTPHIIGAGWTHSPLASATSLGGVGIGGHHTGHNVRNMMAWEWVTPEGDVIRGGSAGAGAGWFAGEGPGPGFRGMLRGMGGAGGGLGVFTRIGYKLHPWAGPSELEHRGAHPQLGIALNKRMRFYQVVWDNWEGPKEAVYGFMISNAPTLIVRIPPDHQGWILYPTNREYYDALMSGSLPEIAQNDNRFAWTLLAVSETDAEAEWRERTIRAIVKKSGGRFLDVAPEHTEVLARNVITSCYVPRAFRSGPRQITSANGVYDSFNLLPAVVKTGERLMAPYKNERKTLCKGSPEEFWMWPTEGRHFWAENIVNPDNDTDKSAGDGYAFVLQTIEENDRRPLGTSVFAMGGLLAEMYGKRFAVNTWMAKVKKTFDPAGSADGIYPTGEKIPLGRIWPFIRPFLFRFPILLRRSMQMQLRKAK